MDIKSIEGAVESLLAQEAVELVDLRTKQSHGRWTLAFYVDKHGGITLSDCERLSGRIGALLDAMDAVEHAYTLEVSSPGVDRVLKKESDFRRFAGHRVKVRLKSPLDGRSRFQGYLKGIERDTVVLESGADTLRVELASIKEARLDPDIKV